MSEEAKTSGDMTSAVTASMPLSEQHVDTMNPVSKFDQSADPIPKVVPPRGSKDARSFRPSTLAEINMMNKYEPLTMKCGSRTVPIACGNSLEDFLLLCGCMFALWCFILGFSALLLKSALDTDRRHTAVWIYFWLFVLFILLLGGSIATGQVERRRVEAAQAEAAPEEEAEVA